MGGDRNTQKNIVQEMMVVSIFWAPAAVGNLTCQQSVLKRFQSQTLINPWSTWMYQILPTLCLLSRRTSTKIWPALVWRLLNWNKSAWESTVAMPFWRVNKLRVRRVRWAADEGWVNRKKSDDISLKDGGKFFCQILGLYCEIKTTRQK